jgi:hypothetical protein
MSFIPYAILGVVLPAIGWLILWQLRVYGESIHDTAFSFWLSGAIVVPCLILLLLSLLRSKAFDDWVDYFKTEEEKLQPSENFYFHIHPIWPIGLFWVLFAWPTLGLIESLPKDSEFRTTLVILAYFVAPAVFFLITWSKPYKDAVTQYQTQKEARKSQQEADRIKAQREAEERAQDAELQARMDALRATPPPRQSARSDLGPGAQKLKDEIDQLYKK